MLVEWIKFQDKKVRGRYLKVYDNALVPWPLPGWRMVYLEGPMWASLCCEDSEGWAGHSALPLEVLSFLEMSSWVVLFKVVCGTWQECLGKGVGLSRQEVSEVKIPVRLSSDRAAGCLPPLWVQTSTGFPVVLPWRWREHFCLAWEAWPLHCYVPREHQAGQPARCWLTEVCSSAGSKV